MTLDPNVDIRFERADFIFRFMHANQIVGEVKFVDRCRWWAPWSRRKGIIFEGDIEKSARLLFQMWGRLAYRDCCTDAS